MWNLFGSFTEPFNYSECNARKPVIECHMACGSFTVESESIGMGIM